MHVQAGVPGMMDAVALLPPGGMVLAIDDGGVLVDAKRINPGVTTALRHFVAGQEFGQTEAERYAIARGYFRSFIDGTYFEKYAHVVDLVLEYNEYTDEGMLANDPDVYTSHFQQAVAMANVWNDEYRPRLVSRLVLCNGPVGNSIDRRFAELAVATDNVLGYHPYIRASVRIWPATIHDPGDWRYHSGRWHFMEQSWGLYPDWAFTEMMPYQGSTEGWRHWACLDGDRGLLLGEYQYWLAHLAETPAFQRGRILGWTGAWFSVGGNWWDYLLETTELIPLAAAAHASPWPGPRTPPMPDAQKAITDALAQLEQVKQTLQGGLAPKHTLTHLTNQQVFNLFQKAFGGTYWSLVTAATDEAYMAAHRAELYKGPAVEDMPGLTDAQKAAMSAALSA